MADHSCLIMRLEVKILHRGALRWCLYAENAMGYLLSIAFLFLWSIFSSTKLQLPFCMQISFFFNMQVTEPSSLPGRFRASEEKIKVQVQLMWMQGVLGLLCICRVWLCAEQQLVSLVWSVWDQYTHPPPPSVTDQRNIWSLTVSSQILSNCQYRVPQMQELVIDIHWNISKHISQMS